MKYRKKPVVIDAVQLTKKTIQECYDFVKAKGSFSECGVGIDPSDDNFKITTMKGIMVANIGDFII